MPAKKKPVKLTQEELFPHGGFHYRLYTIDVDGKKGFNKTAWFQCAEHLTKHIERYKITEGDIKVRDGQPALASDPFAVKVKRTRKTPAKAKTTTSKASGTKAPKVSKAKKPVVSASKTKSAPRTSKKAKKEAFSNLDTFFDK